MLGYGWASRLAACCVNNINGHQFRLPPNQSADMQQFGHLYVVNEDHVDMMHMYDAVRDIVRVNQPGPQLYLRPIYAYYSAVLSDRIKLLTERIFEQSILPGLPVCASFHCLIIISVV